MKQLNDQETAAVLMELNRRNLLLNGEEVEIYALAETYLMAKYNQESEILSPDTIEAQEAATAWAGDLEEAQEMLVEEGVTHERLLELAEMLHPVIEKQVVLAFGT